jgi:hypothetical protein
VTQEPSSQNVEPASTPDAQISPDAVPASSLNLPQPSAGSVKTEPVLSEKESFVKSYLKKAGKAMAFFALLGCGFLMFAAWLIISTFDRIISSIPK